MRPEGDSDDDDDGDQDRGKLLFEFLPHGVGSWTSVVWRRRRGLQCHDFRGFAVVLGGEREQVGEQ